MSFDPRSEVSPESAAVACPAHNVTVVCLLLTWRHLKLDKASVLSQKALKTPSAIPAQDQTTHRAISR